MKRFLLASLCLLSLSVAAYEKPKAVPCVSATPTNLPHCIDPARARYETITFTDGTFTQKDVVTSITCSNLLRGKCVNQAKEEFGFTGRNETLVQYLIGYDYYLYPGNDGKDWAYLRGTGPLFGEAVQTAAVVSSAEKTFEIWCNPQGDTCDTELGEFYRQDLAKHFPMADIYNPDVWCDMEVCYNPQEKVVGLNPDYTGFYQ